MRVTALALIGLALFSTALEAQTGPDVPLTLIDRTGRRTVPTQVLAGVEMIALDDVVTLFDVTVRDDALVGGISVSTGGQTIVAVEGQSMAQVNGRIVTLPAQVTRANGQWLVPLEFLSRALAPIYGTVIDLRRDSRLLLVGDVVVPRVTARIVVSGTTTQATVEFSPAVGVTPTVEAGRVVLRVDADGLDTTGLQGFGGLVSGVSAADVTAVIVNVSPDAGPPRVTPQVGDGVTRITIDIHSSSPGAAAVSPLVPPIEASLTAAAVSGARPTLLTSASAIFDTVVIDAGHGGDDDGVRGRNGAIEKTVTLAVARQLQTLLETRLGIQVILTRSSDRSALVDQRTAVANNNKADLFLSLHAGGALTAAVSGAQVFHARLGREGQAALRAAGGDVAIPVLGGGSRAIEVVPWDLAQAPHVDASAVLAAMVEEALAGRVRMAPRARRDAPLRLLMGANMPAVLVELGYLTNPDDATQLQSTAHHAALAEGLFDAVVRFRAYVQAGGPS